MLNKIEGCSPFVGAGRWFDIYEIIEYFRSEQYRLSTMPRETEKEPSYPPLSTALEEGKSPLVGSFNWIDPETEKEREDRIAGPVGPDIVVDGPPG